MSKSIVAISKRNSYYYPAKETRFRPDKKYPEYKWKQEVSDYNPVYEQVREVLYLLGYDKQNYGTDNWNPLSKIIKKGDTVVLKPNLVMDRNPDGGVQCLFTQASVVAAVIDYVCLALDGTGTIIVGDAPMQHCDWNALMNESGYPEMIDFYIEKGIDIKLIDFREVYSTCVGGITYQKFNDFAEGIVVHLDKDSAFCNIPNENYEKMRITNYDPDELRKHHNGQKHEYYISKQVLEADVIINMPKPKTHRKAGFTAALKNLIGVNVRKEYLPHHTIGAISEGGDEYLRKNRLHSLQSVLLDKKNNAAANEQYLKAKFYRYMIAAVGRLRTDKDSYVEGSWYGNNTISKTIADLNRIVKYADKKGNMQEKPQRIFFSIADMIVSGDNKLNDLPDEARLDWILYEAQTRLQKENKH